MHEERAANRDGTVGGALGERRKPVDGGGRKSHTFHIPLQSEAAARLFFRDDPELFREGAPIEEEGGGVGELPNSFA